MYISYLKQLYIKRYFCKISDKENLFHRTFKFISRFSVKSRNRFSQRISTSVGKLTGVRLLLALYIKGNVYKYKSMQVIDLPSKLWIKRNIWNHSERRLNSKVSKIFGFESERCFPSTEMSPRNYSNSVCQAPFLQSPCAEQNDKWGQAEKCLTLLIQHFGTSRDCSAKAFWFISLLRTNTYLLSASWHSFSVLVFSLKLHSQKLQNYQHSSMGQAEVFIPAFHGHSGAFYHQSHHQCLIYHILFFLTGHTSTREVQGKYKVCCLTTDILPPCY